MKKLLKLATIEKRFKKLHDVANFAEDFARAIAFHAQLLIHEDQTLSQRDVTIAMTEQLNQWADDFAPLASEMQKVESKYYATVQGDMAELIEAVPSTRLYPIPEPYKMTEELCMIGYIEINGDPYNTANKYYSDRDIILNIKEMLNNLIRCMDALGNASYTGVWSDVQQKAIELSKSVPADMVYRLIESYDVRHKDVV